MPSRLPLERIALTQVAAEPGAVVVLDGSQALYVAQTGSMRSWIRRLVDKDGSNYIRRAIAEYLLEITEGSHLPDTPAGLDIQLNALLDRCSVELHPEPTRELATIRKTELAEALHPKLQVKRGRSTRLRSSQQSPTDAQVKRLLYRAGSLSHIDDAGRARMVDVSTKPDTEREAIAAGTVRMEAATLALIQSGGMPKGDVIATARLAGIMAAKRTHDLIPLCHPLLLTDIDVEITPDESEPALERSEGSALLIRATVRTTGKTGVEMEALTAVSIAALTVYDMCKAVDHAIRIDGVRLLRKRGGKSGEIVLE